MAARRQRQILVRELLYRVCLTAEQLQQLCDQNGRAVAEKKSSPAQGVNLHRIVALIRDPGPMRSA
jgi:hypothetical protein